MQSFVYLTCPLILCFGLRASANNYGFHGKFVLKRPANEEFTGKEQTTEE